MAQPGDLIFYRGRGLWYERLIAWQTRGPYVHVEVAVSSAEAIGAMPGGVRAHTIPTDVTLAPTAERLDPAKVAAALDWLRGQVTVDRYGWVDIADDVLRLAFPWGGLVLLQRRRFDCSHLATVFLTLAGYPLPPAVVEAPEVVSPNDLARAVGILK